MLDRWLWLRGHLRRGPLRTFDAGSGNGVFSIYAALEGNEVLGASFSEREQGDAGRRAQLIGLTGVEFRILDLRELASHTGSLGRFDQIICFETIEHLIDDEGLVRTLVGMLSPGGSLLLTAPYEGHRPLYTEQPHPSGVEDGSHVRFGYSQQRLREIAEGAGLEVRDEGYISGLISQQLTNLMRRLSRRLGVPLAWALVLPLRAFVVIDAPVTALFHYPRLSVALQGVKPGSAAT